MHGAHAHGQARAELKEKGGAAAAEPMKLDKPVDKPAEKGDAKGPKGAAKKARRVRSDMRVIRRRDAGDAA